MKITNVEVSERIKIVNPLPSGCGSDIENWGDLTAEQMDDGYGATVWIYAERWADLMEAAISAGESLEQCADRTSHEARHTMQEWSPTGFQHGCAVSYLAEAWEHGEALRRWSNLKLQIGNEGELANETGGTLNPALLTLSQSERHLPL